MPDYAPLVDEMKARYDIRIRKWRTRMSGVAFVMRHRDGSTQRWIEAPYPKTNISLAIFLHEVGHHAVGFGVYRLRCEEEYRVWLWALAKMGELGIEPAERTLRRFDRSIRYAVAKACRRGIRSIPSDMVPYLPAGVRPLGEVLPVSTSPVTAV